MNFIKLPANSEKLLLELVQADNPVQMLCTRFEHASQHAEDELRGILKELREAGYINIQWADNMPYFVTLNNSARTYREMLSQHEPPKVSYIPHNKKVNSIIFISHRSTDKAIADMLADFLCGTGIPRETIFCSSLPGNDINEKISSEVKSALKNSVLNIAILSQDYYQSAYCMNEAGILWYQDDDVPVIPIALPEINSNNMYGFLNSEHKLRRLDSDTDISYIYDAVNEAESGTTTKVSIITYESNKLRKRYADFLKTREMPKLVSSIAPAAVSSEITTDDERIVLYYILKKNVRKLSKSTITKWLHDSEIYGVNVDNAFDLLSSIDGGTVSNDTLEFGINAFRQYSAKASTVLDELKPYVDQHIKLAIDTFKLLWESNALDSITQLFLMYIIEERIYSFGDRWMADGQIESIKQWESKNLLDFTLSNNYGSCLQFLIQNDLVHESDWTSYGNPREYSLCPSLRKLLFNCPEEILQELQKTKNEHHEDLPF